MSESRICRICWNTEGWRKPSGPTGKSTSMETFECRNGFGTDEWLFSECTRIDGNQYGFLEPVNKNYRAYKGKPFDLQLYTIDSTSGNYYYLGMLRDVHVLEPEEQKSIHDRFKRFSVHSRMIQELEIQGISKFLLPEKDISEKTVWKNKLFDESFFSTDETWINVRFPIVSIDRLLYEPLLIVDKLVIKQRRYTLFSVPLGLFDTSTRIGFDPIAAGSDPSLFKGTVVRSPLEFPEKEIEIRHFAIQESFFQYLRATFPDATVKFEHPCSNDAGDARRIDVTMLYHNEMIFYEVKSGRDLRMNLRHALGQLIEYCCYPSVRNAKVLVLVSDIEPTAEFCQYLLRLNEVIAIPVRYIYFDVTNRKPRGEYPGVSHTC